MAAKPIRTSPKVKATASVKSAPKAKTKVAPKPKRTVVTRMEKAKIVQASKGSPKGGSSSAGNPSSSNKQIMDDADDGGKGTGNSIGNGKQYSTLYEANIGNGASRSAHRNAANKEFYNQMANDAQFKNAVDDFFDYDVMGHMKSGKSALKNPSKDWAWHHSADTPGVVRLVPKNQHQSPLLQDILHPGPNGQGGFGLFK
ncbi:hypothetical protein [Cytobacillus purgationiresistens]|uniref:Uncharacterized protein n=1 Tax=Cytobacillus purgationiresistens TaxID=863449 RepID=A0ABU0AMN4_9BACI|nr:hypothetical protein [Cytobacillus purgationiresistens]MDQ0271310.1 hypothetical protein [Cytobacillus purgationiresistens]